jgi:GDP-mannose 4,6-dehydratase
MSIINHLENCRICKGVDLVDVISLGEQTITSRFPVYGDYSTPTTPIHLCMCQACGLIQLRETTNSSELYEHEYGYRSGISNTMKSHLKKYQEEILSKVKLQPGDVIIDIGSNDSTMLQYYSSDIRRIGVDPTGKQFQQYYGEVELLPDYFNYANVIGRFGEIRCKLVSSISMFYDLPDPVQFAKDIHAILDEDGIWTCEQSYILSMIDTNSIDTICHEHLEYYALHQVKEIADRAGFKIIDVKFNDCNGGSFRVYFVKQSSTMYVENEELIGSILQKEKDRGIMKIELYTDFMKGCDREIKYLKDFVELVKSQGKTVYVYGASTKGNCLLQYAKLGESLIQYAVERNPNKIGKMTSTGIEIIGEEKMRENPPDYLLVLPWHFREEILKREDLFLENGGQFIFPFPKFEIIGSKSKVLITGSSGMIAQYVKEEFTNYHLYGISRDLSKRNNMITFGIDMVLDGESLEHVLNIVRPDIIIHLASISSSLYALQHPVETIMANGLGTVMLCEIIHKNGWTTKLFNASSSEIYKGHVDYVVKEDDNAFYHLHPYSIAKIMGNSMVDFYRETYGLPFSNGIIFTTESPLKRPEFLLNKVASHIREWKSGNKYVLTVGNLDSYRNIIHAKDVARAINIIVEEVKGDNYLICGDNSYKMIDLVIKLYTQSGIEVCHKDDILYEVSSGVELLIIQHNSLGFDSTPTNIGGQAKKLKGLGWTTTVSIEEYFEELYNRK